jgi:two-component system cell cycle response regulator
MTRARSILVADDSQLVRRLVTRALEAQGYRVVGAADGLSAVELAWSELPDLVLLDVDMPRMNGYQVARLLRHHARTADIPIVILSSHEAAGDIFWGLEAGADAYLTKSSGEAAILTTVARIFASRGERERDEATSPSKLPTGDLDVLAQLNNLLDQKLYEATVLNQIGQLAAELQDYRRAAERAGQLLARVLDYQAVGVLFLRADPAEALVIVKGHNKRAAPAVAEHLLGVLPGEVRATLPPLGALPLTIVEMSAAEVLPPAGPWQSLALGDERDLWGSFCFAGRAGTADRTASPDMLQGLAVTLYTALDNARLYARLRETAITDGLTGLFNHRYFVEQFARHCRRAEQDGRALSLIMLDVDHFKELNDTLGHQAGDAALREMGIVLRDSVRPGDCAARYGGEEFVILLPDTELATAIVIAERLREGLTRRWLDAGLGFLTVSAGVANAPTTAGFEPSTLLAEADSALYTAKANGRNQTVPALGLTISSD